MDFLKKKMKELDAPLAGEMSGHIFFAHDYYGYDDALYAAVRLIRSVSELGGSLTGEHGIGVDKKAHMPKMFDESDLQAFQKLRCAFDPGGLANPGKIMPTPRLCGEVPGPFREHPLERAGLAERF